MGMHIEAEHWLGKSTSARWCHRRPSLARGTLEWTHGQRSPIYWKSWIGPVRRGSLRGLGSSLRVCVKLLGVPSSTLATLPRKEKLSWCRKLRMLSPATSETIRRYKEECAKRASSMQRMECYSQYLAFSQWAEEQCIPAPGKLL
eukprot:1537944-Pyramimonas_sp.AAC.1